MSDKEKAKKLAAAKKKLKEYRSKERHTDVDSSDASEYGGSTSMKRDVYELQLQQEEQREEVVGKKLDEIDKTQINLPQEITKSIFESANMIQQQQPPSASENVTNSISDYFNSAPTLQSIEFDIQPKNIENAIAETVAIAAEPSPQVISELMTTTYIQQSSEKSHVNAMEILIAEKASLSAELTRQQTLAREKTLEAEELMVQLQMATNRNKLLETEIKELHSKNAALKSNLDEIHKRFDEEKYEIDRQKLKQNELTEHLEELKQELNKETQKNQKLEKQLKEKLCDLELSHIRINQISDEANLVTDNRVEALTQTKFMYEQQICDLQAMVQQLTTERDQANQQYQNYVQHLNKEMTSISDKNSELITENERLANRERQLIEHIGNLEKQIQENITKQENLKQKIEQEFSTENSIIDAEKLEYEKQIDNLKNEKSTLEIKIQSQETKMQELSSNLMEKSNRIIELEEKIENILSDRPNNEKLLATIESDKIAASRALTQNEELKTQLDEVQQKLIQITNDKVELVNLLDSEQYANRKIRENYSEMEIKLKEMQDKLHFKDEEMIRLTHEHNELNKTILQLNQRIDRLMHYEAKEYMRQKQDTNLMQEIATATNPMNDGDMVMNLNSISNNDSELGSGDHHHDGHDHDHSNHQHHHGDDYEDHGAYNSHHAHSHEITHNPEINHREDEECPTDSQTQSDLTKVHKKMPLENNSSNFDGEVDRYSIKEHRCNNDDHNIVNGMPTNEAMEKLQERFRKIMLDVADLTDEKQRLEHLVGQLQDETETIGEYITLYQTQRRLLKQREIEKSTQLRILLTEREEMKTKISNLTQLVENLIVGLGDNQIQFGKSEIPDTTSTINNGYSMNNPDFTVETNSTATPSTNDKEKNITPSAVESSSLKLQQQQLQQPNKSSDLKMNPNQNHPILRKIHNIIAEIKEQDHNLETNLKFVPSVDHCACCSGKYEIV